MSFDREIRLVGEKMVKASTFRGFNPLLERLRGSGFSNESHFVPSRQAFVSRDT